MDYSIIIRKLRNTLLLTQQELAIKINVSFATINRWENRHTEPSIKAKRKIRELCKINKINLEEGDSSYE